MPRQIASAAMVGKWKRGRPRKRGRDEVGDDLNIKGIRNRQAMVRDRREWTKV